MISRQNLMSGVGRAQAMPSGGCESATDIQFSNHGSIWLARPLTDIGQDWIDEHIADDAQWFGGALVIEPRYVADIVEGMQHDGLEVG